MKFPKNRRNFKIKYYHRYREPTAILVQNSKNQANTTTNKFSQI